MSDLDMRDLLLEAQAEVQEVVRELLQELIMPMMRPQVRQMWMTAPDEMKEQFKAERPEEYEALMDMLK
jgi:CO dehydrogenase/acetyl-CoA synthase alpha subunit